MVPARRSTRELKTLVDCTKNHGLIACIQLSLLSVIILENNTITMNIS